MPQIAAKNLCFNDNYTNNHSINKRSLGLRSDTKMRQSMDRFGDDLCQLILSYLPFEDRFRYECVSRQWRRLIFRSQRVLTLEYNWASFFLPTLREGLVFATNRSILKKCQQITEISVNRFVNNRDVVFQVINKYCHNLSAIESDFDGMSARTVAAFCHTFGAQLKKLTFHSNNETNREVFRRCLRSIHVLNIRPFNDLSLVFTGNEVLVHKLREICFTYSNEDSQRIGIFCETNKQTLESIEVTFSANSLTPKSINQLFKGLSKLSELKVLVISCQSEVDDTLVCKCLQLLAAKCLKLHKISLTLSKSHCDIRNSELFQAFSHLKQMRRLSLKLHFSIAEEDLQMKVTAESLRECQHLTHLKIISNLCLITDEFFAGIDKYLPNLQVLELWNVDITGQTFDWLARLSHLRSIHFVCFKTTVPINESMVEAFMKKCPKVKSIYFRNHNYCLEFKD